MGTFCTKLVESSCDTIGHDMMRMSPCGSQSAWHNVCAPAWAVQPSEKSKLRNSQIRSAVWLFDVPLAADCVFGYLFSPFPRRVRAQERRRTLCDLDTEEMSNNCDLVHVEVRLVRMFSAQSPSLVATRPISEDPVRNRAYRNASGEMTSTGWIF